MENPVEKTFEIVKWWATLKLLDKLLVYLLTVIIALTTSLINVIGTNGKLHNTIEINEQRNSNNLQKQRDRDDSIRTEDNKQCELEKERIYSRADTIKIRNDRITKALK